MKTKVSFLQRISACMELSNTIKHSEDSVDVKYYRKVPKAALIPQQGTCFSYLFAIIRHVDTGRCLGAKNHSLISVGFCVLVRQTRPCKMTYGVITKTLLAST